MLQAYLLTMLAVTVPLAILVLAAYLSACGAAEKRLTFSEWRGSYGKK